MSLQYTVNGPLSGCHAETYQPHLGFICVLQTQQHKFTAKSACLHVFWLWLRHKNKPSVYHLFVCACQGRWIFVTMDRLPDSRYIEDSDEKKTCILTFQGAKISLKDAFSFMHLNYN